MKIILFIVTIVKYINAIEDLNAEISLDSFQQNELQANRHGNTEASTKFLINVDSDEAQSHFATRNVIGFNIPKDMSIKFDSKDAVVQTQDKYGNSLNAYGKSETDGRSRNNPFLFKHTTNDWHHFDELYPSTLVNMVDKPVTQINKLIPVRTSTDETYRDVMRHKWNQNPIIMHNTPRDNSEYNIATIGQFAYSNIKEPENVQKTTKPTWTQRISSYVPVIRTIEITEITTDAAQTKNPFEEAESEEKNAMDPQKIEHDNSLYDYLSKFNLDDYDDYDDKNSTDDKNEAFPLSTQKYYSRPATFNLDDIENVNSRFIAKAAQEKKACNIKQPRTFSLTSPRTYQEIVQQLFAWSNTSPMVQMVDITDGNLTTMENHIYMMIIDDQSSGQIDSAKEIVMVVAGIQGSDHYAVSSAMYLLYQLIETGQSFPELLKKYRFWVIPVLNPDGYEYSLNYPHRRMWLKNLRQNWLPCEKSVNCMSCESLGLQCSQETCFGVHLDRNFEYQWIPAKDPNSEFPCGDFYAGPKQLSEAETIAFTTFMHQQKKPIHKFITFKEGPVLGVLYPPSHTRKKRPDDQVYRLKANRAASAASGVNGRSYVYGQCSEYLTLYAGGIEDWVYGHAGIDKTFTIMLSKAQEYDRNKLGTEKVLLEAFLALDSLLITPAPVEVKHAATVSEVQLSDTVAPNSPLKSRAASVLINFCYILGFPLCIFVKF